MLDAATEVFLRYGFARTTMGDIAERAGLSRPSLYQVFPGKEKVFAAAIRRMNDRKLASIRAVLATLPGLREKLLHACEAWGAHGVELLAASPDARDLFDLRFTPVQHIYADFQALIAELIPVASARSALRATPDELARTVTFAMRGFRETAEDAADMRRLIVLQVSVILAALKAED